MVMTKRIVQGFEDELVGISHVFELSIFDVEKALEFVLDSLCFAKLDQFNEVVETGVRIEMRSMIVPVIEMSERTIRMKVDRVRARIRLERIGGFDIATDAESLYFTAQWEYSLNDG